VTLAVADTMEPATPAVAPEDTAESVRRLMREHELAGLPVVNPGGRWVDALDALTGG
jgi:CBS domain-containing protein